MAGAGTFDSSETKPIHLWAFCSFFHSWIFSRLWCSFTSFNERSMWPRLRSTWRTLQTTFCPSRTWSRMYLTQPFAISEMGIRPCRPPYSSSRTKATKSFTASTVQTTSSPSSGQSLSAIGLSLDLGEDLGGDVRLAPRRLGEDLSADDAVHDGRGLAEDDLLVLAVGALHPVEPAPVLSIQTYHSLTP